MQNRKLLWLVVLLISIILVAVQPVQGGLLEQGGMGIKSSGDVPTVLFTDNLSGRVDLTTFNTMLMDVEVPVDVSSGPVVVVGTTGISNPGLLAVGSPALPDLSGIATTWSITVTGTITESGVWSANTLLSGTVTINPGVTLTITPGVTVFGAPGSELVVNGGVIAEGTPTVPIYFTTSVPDPAPGAWLGIRVSKHSHTFVLKYALVQYAQNAVYFLANTEGTANLKGTVSHCTLQYNQRGLYVYTSPDISPWNYTATAQVTFTHNLVYSNTIVGAVFNTTAGGGWTRNYSRVEHNRFEENATGILLVASTWWVGHSDNRVNIRHNALLNNSLYGIDVQAYGSTDGSGSDTQIYPDIENNLFEDNATGLRLYLNPHGNDGTQILDATVRYNTFRHGMVGIRMEHAQNYDTLTATIAYNVFTGFDAPDAYAIANPTGRPLSADYNYWGDHQTAWAWGAEGQTSGTVTVDTFLTAADPPVLTYIEPGSGQAGDILTLHGANFGRPPARPFTLFTDNQLGRIEIAGFGAVQMDVEVPVDVSTGPVVVGATTGASNPAPLVVDVPAVPDLSALAATWAVTVTGTITEDTVWSEDTLLSGAVTINPGITLTILPGVTVFGAPGSELVVNGGLIAEGTLAAPLYFTSGSANPAPGDWLGIRVSKHSHHFSLQYALVQYAQNAIYFRANAEGQANLSGLVSHCTLQHNQYGLHVYTSPDISPWNHTATAQVTFTHNLVYSHTIAGAMLNTTAGGGWTRNYSQLGHNRFEENATGILLIAHTWWVGHSDNRVQIYNNILQNNSLYGIDVQAYGSSDTSGSDTRIYPTIEHNLLEGNPTGLRLYLNPRGSDGAQVLDALVRYNTFRHSSFGIRMQHEEAYNTLTGTIEHNVFYGFDEEDSYAIANSTGRPLSANHNYWGSDAMAWAAGPTGMLSGVVAVDTFLTAADPPVLTHIAPGSGQAGDILTLHGANFGGLLPDYQYSSITAPTALAPDDTLEYTLEIYNSGLHTGNVTLVAPIPAGATYLPGSVAIFPPAAGAPDDSDGITWSGVVEPGARVIITYRVTVLPDQAKLFNMAHISDPLIPEPLTVVHHLNLSQDYVGVIYLPLIINNLQVGGMSK